MLQYCYYYAAFSLSLCGVEMSNEAEVSETDFYTFRLYARKSTIALSVKSADEANEWIAAIQDVIDSCPTIQTITERVILEIIVSYLYNKKSSPYVQKLITMSTKIWRKRQENKKLQTVLHPNLRFETMPRFIISSGGCRRLTLAKSVHT